jgi:hypothetical protein
LTALKRILEKDRPGPYPENFTYDRSDIADYVEDWSAFRDLLADADMNGAVRGRVAAEVQEKLDRARVLANQMDATYTGFEQAHVGLPDNTLVNLAWAILDGDRAGVPFPVCSAEGGVEATVTSLAMRNRMASALDAYGLDDWVAIEEPSMAAQASVNGPRRRVRVRAGTMFSPRAADRLLAHEIGGHVLRWANSQHQPEAWVSVALGRTVPTEEGMAAWREVEFGLQTAEQLRIYAARVVAVDAARSEGLVDVARRILPYVDAQHAAEIAIRAKRGLLDPNGPGGQTKDWGYLAGLLTMAELAKHDAAALRLLAGVKWPIDDLALIMDLHQQGRIHLPERTPEVEKLGLQTLGETHP